MKVVYYLVCSMPDLHSSCANSWVKSSMLFDNEQENRIWCYTLPRLAWFMFLSNDSPMLLCDRGCDLDTYHSSPISADHSTTTSDVMVTGSWLSDMYKLQRGKDTLTLLLWDFETTSYTWSAVLETGIKDRGEVLC